MGKKKKHSKQALSSDSASLSFQNLSVQDISNISLSEPHDEGVPENFRVSSVQSKYSQYAKCLKTDFENVIFINSSVMLAYGIEDLVTVHSESNQQLCFAQCLDKLNKHFVVFPKSDCGFHHDDLVMIQPYRGRIGSAEKIVLASESEEVNHPIQEHIFKLVCYKFLYIGMVIKFSLLSCEHKFTVKHIIPVTDLPNLDSAKKDNQETTYYLGSLTTTLNFDSDASDSNEDSVFQHIGGLEPQIKVLKKHFQLFLNPTCHFDSAFCDTLVLKGPSGTGKSLVLQAIIKLHSLPVEPISWQKLFALSISEIKKKLETAFNQSIDQAPSLIILEDFNSLSSNKDEVDSTELYALKLLAHSLETLKESRVMVVVVTNDSTSNESIFKSRRRLVEVVLFKNHSHSERVEILEKLLAAKNHNLAHDQIRECAESAHGFTGRDFFDAITDAEMLCIRRASQRIPDFIRNKACNVGPILYSDLKSALKLKKPSIIPSGNLQVQKVQWSDIGGMMVVKEKLKQLVEWPMKYPEAFKHFNVAPSRGVLMYGPPGCSKTMIAKALATECSFNFISKNASDLFDKYVGESERAVRELFASARSKAPCIIFLDEIDALVIERGSSSSSSGVGDRVVTTFLTEMDGIEELHGVIVIAATNRPDLLDAAFIRNGRINHFIYVPLPDASTREEILRINMSKRTISKDLDYKALSLKTEGYSGAEIVNICNEAALQLLAENLGADIPVFHMRHFEEALMLVQPRTSIKMIEFYEDFNSKHCMKSCK